MKANAGYSSFEGLHATHPSWEERLSFLDREQSKLWSSMSAFNNGYLFLELEQYLAAEQCFKAVVAEFPDCHEGWANLGYAQLMRYCDNLDADDLRSFGIGHLVAGCFYARPESLESKVRGIDEKTWHSAVKALKTALALKKDLMLPRVCLGIAHLVHPEGKDARRAGEFFADALDMVNKDKAARANPAMLMSLLINGGVADLAQGKRTTAEGKFRAAMSVIDTALRSPLLRTMEDGLLYNLATVEADSTNAATKNAALKRWTLYLTQTSRDSAWWTLGYERYTKLARELGEKPVLKADLVRFSDPVPSRLTTTVVVDGKTIFLSQPIAEALGHLGKDAGVAQPLYPESKMIRWRFASKGVDVLGKGKVVAIFLTNPKGPALTMQAVGGSTKTHALRVGMSEADAEELLKGHRTERTTQYLTERDVRYRFYPSLGLAIRFGDGRVEELALAQVPRLSGAKK